MNKLLNIIEEFVADHFAQPGQLLKPMILPSGVRNRQIKKFKQSRKGMLETMFIAAPLPTQRSLILAADISQLVGQR